MRMRLGFTPGLASTTLRRAATAASVLALAAVLAACNNGDGGSNGASGELDYEDSPLAAYYESFNVMGEMTQEEQQAFYDEVTSDPDSALSIWRRTRAERDATYMREARAQDEARDAVDLEGGGYEGVALALMAAIARGERTAMILNVRNGSAVPGLPPEAVVEVPCAVDGAGPTPLATRPLEGHMLGLVQQVKYVEGLAIRAAVERDPRIAVEAFALHPLVDSVATARLLFDGYRQRIPQLRDLFPR